VGDRYDDPGALRQLGGVLMDKFVVAVFPTQAKALEGARAMRELQVEGGLALYSMAVVTRTKEKLSVNQIADELPLGMSVGALVGGLVGLIGGPAGAGAGLLAGGIIGSWSDLFNLGVDKEFLDTVSTELKPGKSAVVAEVQEEWITPLDTRLEALGGTVLRQTRADFEVDRIQQALLATETELALLKAEYRAARAEDKARLERRIETARATLRVRAARAKEKRERLRQVTEAKITALQAQLARAKAEDIAAYEKRMTEFRVDYERRAAKLDEAVKVLEEAGTA
jgi:uncharacterized membrane protein